MRSCTISHSTEYVCDDPYCHVMQTELMQRTILGVFKELKRDLSGAHCPLLLAQGVCALLRRCDLMTVPAGGRFKPRSYNVTEAHVVMNLPSGLYYMEGVISEVSELMSLDDAEQRAVYACIDHCRGTAANTPARQELLQKIWDKL